MSTDPLIDAARELDSNDTLAIFRDRFNLPGVASGGVYLCGHSLGAAPREARARVLEELDDWDRLGVDGHHAGRRPWIGYAELLKDSLARLVGASPREVVAMNGLTVNLQLLMATFFRPEGIRRCIVVEEGAFSSDRHAVETHLKWHGLGADALIELRPATGSDLVEESQLEALLTDRGAEVALVLWPGVQFRTGQAFDLARIARATRAAGARCGFDLAHAVGNTPLALNDSGADFAVWCGYKYLNGGPGALAGAFVHERALAEALPRLGGWWGHDPQTRFRMAPGFVPADGADGWQLSNPPILSAAPLLASLALFDEAGNARLRAKALAMGDFLIDALDREFASALQIVTPREPERRGCQLSLRVRAGAEAGRRLFAALESRGVVADWREPDIVRVAPVPLYNSFGDLAALVLALRDSLR
ncbi:MAG: kynureninase [Steroidobacteraceae bacterium]